ncbi:hypothetical protein [Pantoea sp. 1.19]|uniref:hypothetical protein n=1 Tax=Pantoea sp. 1.19 TaxID=1925589 RepID=UPI0011152DF7|nr:hypothetical protein [Pantoea sp. 1.19]
MLSIPCGMHRAQAAESCINGMKADGLYYKATSLGGITISNVTTQWLEGGRYYVSMNIVADQGRKEWYSSSNLSDWAPVAQRTDAAAQQVMNIENCSSGLVVAAQQVNNNLPIGSGTATVTLSPGTTGGAKGSSYVIYDERVDGFINMSSIFVSPTVAIGGSKEDDGVIRQANFLVTVSNLRGVADGNYTTNVTIPIGATTTWWPTDNGYNYWWTTAGRSVPLTSSITIPVQIRSSGGQPVNPTINCVMPTSVMLNHRVLRPSTVDGALASSSIAIRCNSASTGSIEITGDNNTSASGASVQLAQGVVSNLSASVNGTNWYRSIPSFPLINGTTTIQIRSVLASTGTIQAGVLSGSAVAVIRYN